MDHSMHEALDEGRTYRRVERKRRSSLIAVEMGERLAIFCDKGLHAFGAKLRKRLVRNSDA